MDHAQLHSWIQTIAIVGTGFYAVFRAGAFVRGLNDMIGHLTRRVEAHSERIKGLEDKITALPCTPTSPAGCDPQRAA